MKYVTKRHFFLKKTNAVYRVLKTTFFVESSTKVDSHVIQNVSIDKLISA